MSGAGRAGWAATLVATAVLAQPQVEMPPEMEGAIVGRVCQDLNADGLCQADEPGLVGIRVVLETGQQALTDFDGRYHFAGVPSRSPDYLRGARLLPGRHRVKLDTRSLAVSSVASPPAATVEVPMAGLVMQDFAIRDTVRGEPPLRVAPEAHPPAGELARREVFFDIVGQAQPGDRVRVAGEEAHVDASGSYRARVPLKAGANDLNVSAVSPEGNLRVFSQHVDVIQRAESVLVVPRQLLPSATVILPAPEGAAAPTGASSLRIEATPGTRIAYPGGDVVVDASGTAQVPITLEAGGNEVSLKLTRPGEQPRETRIQIQASPRPFAAGLLDLEGSWGTTTGLRLWGRGAAHGEVPFAGWLLTGELDLRDSDFSEMAQNGPRVLAGVRDPEVLERSLDPRSFPTEWADQSTTLTPNAPEGRIRAEASNPNWGRIGFGTHRAQFEDGEIGRYQRELFGSYLDLKTPTTTVQAGARAFYAPGFSDPVTGQATLPAHDELNATGGSVYYLHSPPLVQGSEVVRVEVRDGLTGLPIAERHLVRGRDYEVNYLMGWIILAKPLSFVTGTSPLPAEAITANPSQALMVDYEFLPDVSVSGRRVAGGEVTGKLGPVNLSAGGVREGGPDVNPYDLLRARVTVPLGPISLSAEAAQSRGRAVSSFAFSDDGGLSFWSSGPLQKNLSDTGSAFTVLLRGPGFGEGGYIDAAYRRRFPGYADESHDDRTDFRQASVRAEQPVGPFVIGLLGDDRVTADPRLSFQEYTIAARTLAASLGFRRPDWEVHLEGRDSQLQAAPDANNPSVVQFGGRTSLGLAGRYRLLPWLALTATYQQVLAIRGEGLGAYNDTFVSGGFELSPNAKTTVGVRGGWGPALGPQVWFDGNSKEGANTYYGTYSVDTDGPDVGTRKSVFGARTEVGDRTAVFVEDIAAHDANSIRMSHAVGISNEVMPGFDITGRYERGVRDPLDIPSPLLRDAGSLSASWVRERVRLFGRAEVRFDRGTTIVEPTAVNLVQRLLSGAVQVEILKNLHASGRINYSDTANFGVLEARLLDASAGIAWRLDYAMFVLHYGITRSLGAPLQTELGSFGERNYQTVSFMPSLRITQRFTLGAGGSAVWNSQAGNTKLILFGSLRPAVRVVGGLELAAEVARRSSADDGGELTSLRGEAGYRFNDEMMMALGYTAFGYTGAGFNDGAPGHDERLYLRAELAY